MDRATHCPNCFRERAPAPHCSHCGFDAASYLETNEILPLFTALAAGKYLVGRVLGEGGFGVVYAGLAQRLKRPVAIKEFFPAVDNPLAQRQGVTVTARPRYQDAFANWKDQFLREAELLAQFNHPRIVQVHDIVEENNTVYLIMERLEGQTLSEHLGGLHLQGEVLKAARHLSPDDGRRLLDAALEALDVLHGHVPPVLHRDLTPHNLFLVDNRIERLKVLDFGLARLGERTQSVVSLAVRVGNPGFAAPEQLGLYPGDITTATDFYTLGATLYTALAGVAPPNAQQRCTGQPPQSLPLLPDLDPILAQVIRACLEISPQKRPHSVADFRKRLAAGTVLFPDPESIHTTPLPAPPPPPEPELKPELRPQSIPEPQRFKIIWALSGSLIFFIISTFLTDFLPENLPTFRFELNDPVMLKLFAIALSMIMGIFMFAYFSVMAIRYNPKTERPLLSAFIGFMIFIIILPFLIKSLPSNPPKVTFELNDPITWKLFAITLSIIMIIFLLVYSMAMILRDSKIATKSKLNLQPAPELVLEPMPLLIPKSALELEPTIESLLTPQPESVPNLKSDEPIPREWYLD